MGQSERRLQEEAGEVEEEVAEVEVEGGAEAVEVAARFALKTFLVFFIHHVLAIRCNSFSISSSDIEPFLLLNPI